MTDDEAFERVRLSRSSGAVLRLIVSNLRSRHPFTPLLVFEGRDDVGPYETWISRINEDFTYEPVAAKGKSQVLDFRQRLERDRTGLASGVFLFVDKDFDGLRNQTPGPDIFCTASYSIENYLVSERVVRSIVVDEFNCSSDPDDRDRVLEAFRRISADFDAAMRCPNLRLCRAILLGLVGPGIDDNICSYVNVSVYAVTPTYDQAKLMRLIPLTREPEPDECARIDSSFGAMDPRLHYRGKFLLAFLRRWLHVLMQERRQGNGTIFLTTRTTKGALDALTLRSLASRSEIPHGLADFIKAIANAPPVLPLPETQSL